jgi:glycosyltransferase involved in cell wall biosynthesis
MRILHTVTRLNVGGVNSLLLQNLASLPDLEQHVAYLTANASRANEYRALGIEPYTLNHPGAKAILRTFKKAIGLIRSLQPDVVHVNHVLDSFYFSMAARRCNVPVIATLHSTSVPSLKYRILQAPLSRVAARFVAVSDAVKTASCGYLGLPPDKVEVIYSGIDTRNHGGGDPDLRHELGINAEVPVLINVGRLHPVKNQILLIPLAERVLEEHPKAELLIVGHGGEWESLKRAWEQSPARCQIHLLGQRSDVRELLKVADVYVSASTSEGFSVATLEAMAAGLPIVATDIAASREAVPPEAGTLVPVGDIDAAAGAITQLLSDPERRLAMGEHARQVAVETFDVRAAARALRELYASVAR